MGQAALKLEAIVQEAAASAPIVTFKPAGGGARPKLVESQAKSDLPGLLSIISRVANLLAAHRDRGDLWEKRHAATDEQLKASGAKIIDLEVKLKAATDEAKIERARAADIHRRSAEMVEKTRAMLTDASQRLKAAESRAEKAESGFATIRDAVERQLGPQLR